MLAHDSYTCSDYWHGRESTVGFPDQRAFNASANFIGGVHNQTLNEECPRECRRRPEWTYC